MQIKRNLYHCIKTLIKNVFLLNFAYEFLFIFIEKYLKNSLVIHEQNSKVIYF